LDALASEVAFEETRRALGLRFLVVTMTRSGRFLEQICDNNNPYVVSCYKLEFGSQNHFVALLDLRNELKEIAVSPAELVLPLIPIFPSSEQEACRGLTMYALKDITKRLQN